MRILRTIVVAGLLAIALVAAVLGSIGNRAHMWDWAHLFGAEETATGVLDRS